MRTAEGAPSKQDKKPKDIPSEIPNGPPSRTPSFDVSSEFPPPPPGIGADDETISPAYIIPRKPPRPNSGVTTKTTKFNDITGNENDKTTNSRDVGRKNDHDRISVALNKSLEDLLSHLDASLPGIEEHPKGTPPETRTPTNSLESSQEFLDGHVNMFHHVITGSDVATITEENFATKYDDDSTERETPFPKFNETSSNFVNATSKTDDAFAGIADALANLDDVNAKFDEVTTDDDDLAAFLGLDDFNDCLNQIEEAMGAKKSDQASASYLDIQPIGGADSGDSDDSSDYEFPIGNESTFSGPLPPAGFTETADDPHYENRDFLWKYCQGGVGSAEGETERPETLVLPPYPSNDEVAVLPASLQFYPVPQPDASEANVPDDDQQTYDIPQPIDEMQTYEIPDSPTYDIPQNIDDPYRKVKKKTSTGKQTTAPISGSDREQTKTTSPQTSSKVPVRDRPPPPKDAPPKPLAKKTGTKKSFFRKLKKGPPLPPKDADLLVTRHQAIGDQDAQEEEDPYSTLDDVLAEGTDVTKNNILWCARYITPVRESSRAGYAQHIV
jgi:hypothetical protein